MAVEKELRGADRRAIQFARQSRGFAGLDSVNPALSGNSIFTGDRNEAVLVLECRDLAEAENALQTLPLVKEKLIAFDLIPLKPYPGFARLFA